MKYWYATHEIENGETYSLDSKLPILEHIGKVENSATGCIGRNFFSMYQGCSSTGHADILEFEKE